VGDAAAVGIYPTGASPYGALDMAGNVWQWVSDWFGANYYASSPVSNPQGPADGISRVMRGGSWYSSDYVLRSSARNWGDPALSNTNIGFRCSRSTSP
jgi:formylglycine-generating enzyme required for sulfatase activity